MSNPLNWVVVGRFGRPHGIKGFVTVHSFTEPRDNILSYTGWHVSIKNTWQPINLLSMEAHNKAIIALVEGYSDRDSAALLTNAEIGVDGTQLAELKPGDYYWHQLIGMKVVNQQGEPFGTVVEMLATGSNDVLVVQGDKKHFIPYLPGRCVLDVNTSLGLITVDWDVDF
jgi:16S rRNA processing protein RimM